MSPTPPVKSPPAKSLPAKAVTPPASKPTTVPKPKSVSPPPVKAKSVEPTKAPAPPAMTAMERAMLLSGINAFGDIKTYDEEAEDEINLEEEKNKKAKAKALLAAALKKHKEGDGEETSGSSSLNKAKRTIYVRGFMDDPSKSIKLELFRFFKQFGKVSSVNMGYSKEQGLQYTWAAVEFEDDSIIKDLLRPNIFMDGFPLHIVRKKDNWDTDSGPSKLDSTAWKHVYLTGLDQRASVDDIHRFLDVKFGGVKKVDCRVVNGLSIFLVEFNCSAKCVAALKGGSLNYTRDIYVWPPYVYEDLCVRKHSFDQQLAAMQTLCETPARKLIHYCLLVQKMEAQLRSVFPECSLKMTGDVLSRVLPKKELDLYFEFTDSDTELYRDPKAPKVNLDDVREGSVPVEQLGALPGHARLTLLSQALEELGVAENGKVIAQTVKRKGALNFTHAASSVKCSVVVSRSTETLRASVLQLLQQHDARFATLYFAFRQIIQVWSKSDDKTQSLPERHPSDIVMLIMTMVYLQQVKPPVLPSIRDLQALTEETQTVEGWNCTGGQIPVGDIPRPDGENRSTVLTLLTGLMHYYAKFDYDNFALSPYYGRAVPLSLVFTPCGGQDEFFKVGAKMNVQDIFALNRNLTPDMKSTVRDSMVTACTQAYAALSSPDIEDSSLLRQVVWGFPMLLNEFLLKGVRPIAEEFYPVDQHLESLGGLEIPGLETSPKKDIQMTEYIYMIKSELPPTLRTAVTRSNNLIWFHHISYLIYRTLAYTLLIHCKVVDNRYPLTQAEAVKASTSARRSDGDEAIEKIAEFWCFTPIKLRKNYATYWTSSGKAKPAQPSTSAELFVLQNLYREVFRKNHACYSPVFFRVVLEQMNTAQPAIKMTLTGEHIHKPLLDFLKDYVSKLVTVQYGEILF